MVPTQRLGEYRASRPRAPSSPSHATDLRGDLGLASRSGRTSSGRWSRSSASSTLFSELWSYKTFPSKESGGGHPLRSFTHSNRHRNRRSLGATRPASSAFSCPQRHASVSTHCAYIALLLGSPVRIRCAGCSASFHTFTAHSMAVSHAWNRLDYIGIVVLIVGTIIPCVRYGFFCSTDLQHFCA